MSTTAIDTTKATNVAIDIPADTRTYSDVLEKKKNVSICDKSKIPTRAEYERLNKKYPGRVPCIVIAESSLKLDKSKYLVPREITVSQFKYILRQRLQVNNDPAQSKKPGFLAPEEALFLFTSQGTLPAQSSMMAQLQKEDADPKTGFVVLSLTKERTFGW
jgi:GABA(A) receptor-associated protein